MRPTGVLAKAFNAPRLFIVSPEYTPGDALRLLLPQQLRQLAAIRNRLVVRGVIDPQPFPQEPSSGPVAQLAQHVGPPPALSSAQPPLPCLGRLRVFGKL